MAATSTSSTVTLTPEGDALRIALAGHLDADTLPALWPQVVPPVAQSSARHLILDATGLTYADGSSLGLIAELRRLAAARQGDLQLAGLPASLRALVDAAALPDPTAPQLRPPPRVNPIARLGEITAGVGADLYDLVAFIGQLTLALLWAAGHPRRVRIGDMLLAAEKVGANAIGIVSLLGFLVGLILAFQTAVPMQRYGAQTLIPTIVTIAVVRELGPLIAAIILAGRSGSAFAAEIGTMKVTEELNALESLGLDPVRFLVIPRTLATLAVTPLLATFCSVAGIIGGFIVMRASYGYSARLYYNAVADAATYQDWIGGIAKTFAFALIVAGVGCLRGMRTRSGPGAVGDSTTRAVVAAIILIIAADAAFGVVYFYLGI